MAAPDQPRAREGTAFHWPGDGLSYRGIDHATCVKRTEDIKAFHINNRGYSDIAYNVVVCPHGQRTGGRGVDKMSGANGRETKNANSRWGAVLFLIGQDETPTDEQYAAAEAAAKELGGDDRIGHSDIRSTACPGKVISAWAHAGAPTVVEPPTVPPARPTPKPTPPPTTQKSIRELALEVIAGKWGSGDERKRRLGSKYGAVQAAVNALLNVKPSSPKKSVATLAQEVINGHWSNGDDRARRLKAAGYDPKAVQAEVNRILLGKAPGPRPKDYGQVAREVIDGKWGNGVTRKRRLRSAGYNYEAVQAVVNRLLK